MCLRDFLGDWFETPALKAGIALPALLGSYVGPWAPSTSSLLLFDEAAKGRELEGSVRTLLDSLERKCAERGVQVRTSCAFEEILLENGCVCGVRVQGGEEFSTEKVLSTLDPKTTILDGFAPGYVPFKMRESMANVRSRGITSVLMFALDGELKFQGAPNKVERFCVAEDLPSIEKCFDAPKYGVLPEHYVLEGAVPSYSDAGLAPQGKHVVMVWAHGTAKELRSGWSRDNRESLIQGVSERISTYAPGFSEQVEASALFTPEDIETTYGVRGGHLFHVEPALDQVWGFRPTIHCSRYQTPIKGLFLGGSGSHPGGGVSLAPGALAAKALLN
jgi:phytoene dehydrogenase-like protein